MSTTRAAPSRPAGDLRVNDPEGSPSRLPLVVLVLALGTFLMGTSEFMVAGLLPQIAGDLQVSVAQAGLLITVFALGMIVGAPVMAMLTLRLPARWTLVLALGLFAVGHLVAALGSGFGLLLAARLVTALATGAFWAVANVVATRAAGPAASSRAVGVVGSGAMLANVVGVPLGAFAGQLVGWRGPFWALAVLAAAAMVAIARWVPNRTRGHGDAVSVRSELSALRSGRVWLVLAACVTTHAAVLGTYTYIAPLLTDRAGIAPGLVPLVLVGFGGGALAGFLLGGRLGDLRPHATTVAAAAATALTLLALGLLPGSAAASVALVVLLGFFGFVATPVLISLAVRFAGRAPTLGSALTVAAFNPGTAAGSWVAGRALVLPLGAAGPATVGAAVAALTLFPTIIVARARCRRRTPSLDWPTARPR
ncbi:MULTISPECIES: MFS transporter [unclassified Streptomyces]|uniref:MFS transporter n=1 Tax=unclassified Streptomyces TaxID=2593676 RepID=UPI0035D8218C